MVSAPITLGVDIGGSKTHALAASAGETVLDCTTGSANMQSVSAELVGERFDEIFGQLDAGRVRSVCVGAAGADSDRQIAALRAVVHAGAPRARVVVVHDTELLLAAAGREHGIALLSGTGSVAWGRAEDGRTARAGGWGYLLGDEGSGYWVFREAVRHAFQAADRGQGLGRLGEAVLGACGCGSVLELLDHVYAHPERRLWAQRAVIALDLAERGDPAATRIRDQAADCLVELAQAVRSRLEAGDRLQGGGTLDVVLAGGLLTNTASFQGVVRAKLLERGFAQVSVLDKPPAYGALVLAERNL